MYLNSALFQTSGYSSADMVFEFKPHKNTKICLFAYSFVYPALKLNLRHRWKLDYYSIMVVVLRMVEKINKFKLTEFVVRLY